MAKPNSNYIMNKTDKTLDKELLKQEKIIRVANRSFVPLGDALSIIQTESYYVQRKFKTFELYVERFFDMGRDYAYKMIAGSKVYGIIKDAKFTPAQMPKVETHVRHLTKLRDNEKELSTPDIIAVWSEVVEQGTITEKAIKAIVNDYLGIVPKTKTDNESDNKDGSENESGSDDKEKATDVTIETLKARIVELENQLQKERETKKGIAGTKIAREMIQAGFSVLVQSATDDQKDELIETKKALLG